MSAWCRARRTKRSRRFCSASSTVAAPRASSRRPRPRTSRSGRWPEQLQSAAVVACWPPWVASALAFFGVAADRGGPRWSAGQLVFVLHPACRRHADRLIGEAGVTTPQAVVTPTMRDLRKATKSECEPTDVAGDSPVSGVRQPRAGQRTTPRAGVGQTSAGRGVSWRTSTRTMATTLATETTGVTRRRHDFGRSFHCGRQRPPRPVIRRLRGVAVGAGTMRRRQAEGG